MNLVGERGAPRHLLFDCERTMSVNDSWDVAARGSGSKIDGSAGKSNEGTTNETCVAQSW